MKPRIFIASPLFNPAQHAVISSIEDILTRAGYEFYSARHHSGSHLLSPEDKKVLKNWDPIFQSNVDGLNDCDVCIANIGYQYPAGTALTIFKDRPATDQERNNVPPGYFALSDLTQVELPDAGTVWEMGYMRAQGKLVVGYHPEAQPKHLNLMLTHGCDGIITGVDNLSDFIYNEGGQRTLAPYPLPNNIIERLQTTRSQRFAQDVRRFWWPAVHGFDAASKEVE